MTNPTHQNDSTHEQSSIGEKNLARLIASMTPSLQEGLYTFATFAHNDLAELVPLQPLGTFIEAEGITAIITTDTAKQRQIPINGEFRCITLNVHSSLDAVGLTAAVAQKLTRHNISANVVAAFYHDHVFVASNDATEALVALQNLTQEGLPD